MMLLFPRKPPGNRQMTSRRPTAPATTTLGSIIEALESRQLFAVSPTTTMSPPTLTLVNAATDRDVGRLTGGMVVNLGTVGTQLNVRANVPWRAASVRFTLDGRTLPVENQAPFALAGNNGPDYFAWTPTAGTHTLTATPFTGYGGRGTAGPAVTVRFTVRSSGISEPPPPGPSSPPSVAGWSTGAPSPIARAEAMGAAVNGKLYVFGGIHGHGSGFHFPITGRSDVYDPGTNSWHRLADMPERFTHANAAVDGSDVWFVGSYVGNTPGPGTSRVWKYNTASNTWTRGPNLPAARGSGGTAVLGRNLHYFGGRNERRERDESTHWVLNLDRPGAGWVRRADLPNPRNHMAAAAVGGRVYAVGGQRGEAEDAVGQSDVHAYDPGTNTWTRVASLPGPRSHATASTFAYGSHLIVVGGESRVGQYHRDIFAYDPAQNRWTTIAYLPQPRGTAVAGIIDGKLIASTGNPGQTSTTFIGRLA